MSKKSVKGRGYKLRNRFKILLLLLVVLCGCLIFIKYKKEMVEKKLAEEALQEELRLKKIEEEKQKKEYDDCLKLSLNEDKGVIALQNDFLEELNNKYEISFMFEDLNSGYKVGENEKRSHYAASTIKLLDALYLYTMARNGNVDLNDTKVYAQQYSVGGLKNYKVGDEISIRNLVKEAILISDNNAHLMLVDYIGFNNLKVFGNDLGATTTLIGGDKFGNISAYDANLYLKELYNFLSIDDVYSKELYDFFLNADQNYFTASDVDVLHKYGNYSYYYNDLSIVYEDNPYTLVILSYYGEGNYEDIFADIQLIVNNFSKDYNQYKVNYCTNMIYEKTES